jgi:hypothetical protein
MESGIKQKTQLVKSEKMAWELGSLNKCLNWLLTVNGKWQWSCRQKQKGRRPSPKSAFKLPDFNSLISQAESAV